MSAIIMVEALRLAEIIRGMIEASITERGALLKNKQHVHLFERLAFSPEKKCRHYPVNDPSKAKPPSI